MKESNSTNKLQTLIKLAFVLFWFARGPRHKPNVTKPLAVNQDWNTSMTGFLKNPLFN